MTCPIADTIFSPTDGKALPAYPFEFKPVEFKPAESCYTLYVTTISWEQAKNLCEALTINAEEVNARLVAISSIEEHENVLGSLIDLKNHLKKDKNVTLEGPWTLGVRNFSVKSPQEAGAFYWSGDSINWWMPSEPWLIFPCAEDCADNNGQHAFWGNRGGNEQQPDYYLPELPSLPDPHCVRYGISDPWLNGAPGLADDKCTDEKSFICEWHAQSP